MSIQNILDWGVEYFSEYISAFFGSITKPNLYFLPKIKLSELSTSSTVAKTNINSRLFVFVISSILLGLTFNSFLPTSAPYDTLTIVIVTFAIWLAYSIGIYILSKVTRGKGGFIETVSICLQMFGVSYVLGNFSAFLVNTILSIELLQYAIWNSAILDLIQEEPMVIYFCVQLIFLSIYIPAAIKSIHGASLARTLVLGIILPIIIFCNVLFFLGIQVNPFPPTR